MALTKRGSGVAKEGEKAKTNARLGYLVGVRNKKPEMRGGGCETKRIRRAWTVQCGSQERGSEDQREANFICATLERKKGTARNLRVRMTIPNEEKKKGKS